MSNSDLKPILEEVLEHTRDCDSNRSQHFYLYDYYQTRSNRMKIVQVTSLLVSICLYIIPAETGTSLTHNWIMDTFKLFLVLVAVIVEIMGYFKNYDGLSQQHWQAGQAFSRLYRECQFFYAHNSRADIEVLRHKAMGIANEINDLNLMSPDLSEKSYRAVGGELEQKSYPIEQFLKDLGEVSLECEIETIIHREFVGYKIDILIFGSYLQTGERFTGDIDIAILLYSPEMSESEIMKRVSNIEKLFLNKNIDLDVTVLTPEEWRELSYIPFLKNLKRGIVLSGSVDKFSGIGIPQLDYEKYRAIIDSCYGQIDTTASVDSHVQYSLMYKYLYNVIVFLLLIQGVDWSSERMLRKEFYKLANNQSSDSMFMQIFDAFNKLLHLKNREMVVTDVVSTDGDLLSEVKKIHTWVMETQFHQ